MPKQNMKIPYMHVRGGSSKGLYFLASDLPSDIQARDQTLILAMEGTLIGDTRQIDGLGGAHSLTSKVAIVSKSEIPGIDLDFLFVQVVVGKARVSLSQTCGNILAGVLHFAVENKLIEATHPTTKAKVKLLNTAGICEVIIETPNGIIETKGNAKVDGVPGFSAPVLCNYLDTVGSSCGALFPTGNKHDKINGLSATCIDNGMPIVLLRALDFGISGNESVEELESNLNLKNRVEQIRLLAGPMMNLGDVSSQTVPKMCLISRPQNGGVINTRMFIPHVVHDAIGVLAAASVATACLFPKTILHEFIDRLAIKTETLETQELVSNIIIEHPTGEFTVAITYQKMESELVIKKSGLMRTARILSKGVVYILRG